MEIEGLTFREINDQDSPFLRELYRSTREQELDQVPWTESVKAQFIGQQFQAQHNYYKEQFQKASFSIILIRECKAGPVKCVSNTMPEALFHRAGRLYLEERDEEFRIIDIAFLPEFRREGWGTKIIQSIQGMADKKNKGIGIHVEKNNPAMNLYLRLGFENKEDKGVYQFMMWRPAVK